MTTISSLDRQAFKAIVRNKCVDLYILTNSKGAEACFSNFAAALISFCVPNRSGQPVDIVLGQPSIAAYSDNPDTFLGATVGRYCNRISNASYRINGREFTFPHDNGPFTRHSGKTGFHNQVFDVAQVTPQSILFSYCSPDGDNGFPGTLQTQIRWTLTEDNELIMDTVATTDAPTHVSITNHSFFNLDGGNCDAMSTLLQLNADFYLPCNENVMPTGEIRPVAGTNFDFTIPQTLAARIEKDDGQLRIGSGYDHNFVINRSEAGRLETAAVAYSEKTGIQLEVKTTLPGFQLYSGNWLDGTPGKKPETFNHRRFAFCIEAQYFPDSPNRGHFPSSLLVPGQMYHHIISFKASTK
jgi:aldose 1-epimerase